MDVDRIGPPPEERPYNIDQVRATLAYWALGIFVFTIAIGFISIMYVASSPEANGANWERARELLQIAIPVESLLIGGAVGFYYGTKS